MINDMNTHARDRNMTLCQYIRHMKRYHMTRWLTVEHMSCKYTFCNLDKWIHAGQVVLHDAEDFLVAVFELADWSMIAFQTVAYEQTRPA